MYIPMWHMWSSNLFYAILYVWQMKCQWWTIVWIRCETLVKYWRIDYWCLRDILATHLRHEFEPNESHFDSRYNFAPQSGTSDCKGRQENVPRCSAGATHFSIASHCAATDSSENRFWFSGFSGGIQFMEVQCQKTNLILYHAESHFERFPL